MKMLVYSACIPELAKCVAHTYCAKAPVLLHEVCFDIVLQAAICDGIYGVTHLYPYSQ